MHESTSIYASELVCRKYPGLDEIAHAPVLMTTSCMRWSVTND